MNKLIKLLSLVSILLFPVFSMAIGQDTTYFTNDGLKLLSKEKADFYEVVKIHPKHQDIKVCNAFYISGKRKKSVSYLMTNFEAVIQKKENPIWKIDGLFEEWFKSGTMKLSANFKNDYLDGELRTYWENGKLKRKNQFEYDFIRRTSISISGKCYNKEGEKVEFYPYIQPAQFIGGNDSLQAFIKRNIRKEYTDSFKVANVKFYVSETGKVSNVSIENLPKHHIYKKYEVGNHNSNLKMEAIRIISSMPNWLPLLIDGEPVGQSASQIIQFGKEPETIYTVVEQIPKFVGGEDVLKRFITANLQYPKEAIKNNIQGRVIVKFVVTNLGKIDDIIVLRGFDKECELEAIRLIKSMPDWIPGRQNGKSVNCYFVLPINFKI
jgi:TonB family protein